MIVIPVNLLEFSNSSSPVVTYGIWSLSVSKPDEDINPNQITYVVVSKNCF